jgi:SAM-dependent methyltransferase
VIRAGVERLAAFLNRQVRIEANQHAQELRVEIARLQEANSQLQRDVQAEALLAAGLTARAQRLRDERDFVGADDARRKPVSFEDSLRRLEALNPRLYPIWRKLFDNGARTYAEDHTGSCSHREHRYALLFGAYLEIYGHGRILDIGCGPRGLPSYLATRRAALVHGLEPLPLQEQPSFEVVRGFNEFLPWDDAQFDTVVSGTSLDHVLSLDASLAEVRRVLKPDGRYLVWLASIAGAPAFDEHRSDAGAIDDFHLFHFDRAWIEPLFEKHFEIADVMTLPQAGFDHVFYCLRPSPARPQTSTA